MELADMADSNSEKEQDANTSVDNICYAKIKIQYKSGSGKDAVEKKADMIDNSKQEQDMGTSVDNTCYEKLQSK